MNGCDSKSVPAALPRVLVIDDDAAARQAVAQGLRDAGCDVSEAGDAATGLEAAVLKRPDVVLLDLRLPDVPGERLLERLRQASDVPVIVISAKREEEDRIVALDLGADDYLVKPFTVRELLARLRALLRRSEGIMKPVVDLGPVSVDLGARAASRDGSKVPLTAQEFVVLECLTRHRGRIVTRRMLEESLHPDEPAPPPDLVSNIVDVIVLRLRRKLGHDLISTRRGQGFIIDG